MENDSHALQTHAHALLVGNFSERERETLTAAAARSSATTTFCQTQQRAMTRLRSHQDRPTCVLVSGDLNVRQLIDAVRDEAELFTVPVLVLLPYPSSSAYRDAYFAGADDVLLASDGGGLTRRLANLSLQRSDARPEATLGYAVIVSSDEVNRRRFGRTLRQVGFDVSYASNLSEAKKPTSAGDAPAFVITDLAREGNEHAVAELGGLPVLFLGPNDIATPTRAGDQVADLTGRLLFFADEQAKAKFKDRRSSARKLYATICSFREGGSLQPVYGVTHNVSREGMYVRTLDPPRPQSTVWLELLAPQTETHVHLRARALWRRLPGSGPGVLPPGFGLRIEAGECPPLDLQAFIAGYELAE